MKHKDLKNKIYSMVNSNITKSEIFITLKNEGFEENQLAKIIAKTPNKDLCSHYSITNKIFLALFCMQAMIALLASFAMLNNEVGLNALILAVIITIVISFLFAWGFYKYSFTAYTLFIILNIYNMPKSIAGILESPITSGVGLSINILLLVLAWFLKAKLYPDMGFVNAKKDKAGEYQFNGYTTS